MAGIGSTKRKLVFVDVHVQHTQYPLEFAIENSDKSGKSDLQVVIDLIKKKKPCLEHMFDAGGFDFQTESALRPGKWVSVGETSPLKEDSNLKCIIAIPNNFNLNLNARTDSTGTGKRSIVLWLVRVVTLFFCHTSSQYQ